MNNSSTPPFHVFLLPAILMASVGWIGLLILTQITIPTVGPRWLFFFFLVLALTGSALPLAAFLNQRFVSSPPASGLVVVREALWLGIYGATIAWLQIGRVLTPTMILLLLVGLILIESLLRMNERSQWKP